MLHVACFGVETTEGAKMAHQQPKKTPDINDLLALSAECSDLRSQAQDHSEQAREYAQQATSEASDAESQASEGEREGVIAGESRIGIGVNIAHACALPRAQSRGVYPDGHGIICDGRRPERVAGPHTLKIGVDGAGRDEVQAGQLLGRGRLARKQQGCST